MFVLQAHQANIKGVLSKLYHSVGNLMCDEDDQTLFTNDWALVWYQYHNITW